MRMRLMPFSSPQAGRDPALQSLKVKDPFRIIRHFGQIIQAPICLNTNRVSVGDAVIIPAVISFLYFLLCILGWLDLGAEIYVVFLFTRCNTILASTAPQRSVQPPTLLTVPQPLKPTPYPALSRLQSHKGMISGQMQIYDTATEVGFAASPAFPHSFQYLLYGVGSDLKQLLVTVWLCPGQLLDFYACPG